MRNLKRMAAFLTALILWLGLSVTAFAAETGTGFSDVDAEDWYAEAAVYCRDNGLMAGTGETTFSPDTPMTRGMLVTVLYRLAGSPSLENENLGYPFADVPGNSWYAAGVYWARLNGVVSGYSDSAFGPNDPLTREQLSAILWRYAGSPAVGGGASFADESDIAAWAASAVDWAQESGYVSGVGGNRFDPDGTATRAQVAVILMRYDQARQRSRRRNLLPRRAQMCWWPISLPPAIQRTSRSIWSVFWTPTSMRSYPRCPIPPKI